MATASSIRQAGPTALDCSGTVTQARFGDASRLLAMSWDAVASRPLLFAV